MRNIKEFFVTESTPRWQILLGGAVVILFGFIQNEVYYRRALHDTEVAQQQQRIESKVVEIQQHSIDFQTFANSYVTAVLDGSQEMPERRDALIANILAQDAAVDVSRNILGPSVETQVAAYRAALRNMKAAVEQVVDVVSMGPFWSEASDLLVARNNLLDALEAYSSAAGS
ncbi:hypothetical protein [Paracoccus jeotgali]|uniref:hypothetical protein n=1 Tax=Paracoccus jeotgali TaxID=2065379 RepID=UPI001315355F|nr:hypothetical protein [Paracoccus jeotgali]